MDRIKPRQYLIFALAGLLLGGLMLLIQPHTFYMDADYYYANGKNLANGSGMQESFLWNYLDSPKQLPHPAFTYWMPAASLIAGFAMRIFSNTSLMTARLPFVILYALVPPLTVYLSQKLSKNKAEALIAGCFALFAGYYLKFVTQVDSVGLYMLAGSVLFMLLANETSRFHVQIHPAIRWLIVGATAGVIHLSRADGLLWCVLIGGIIVFRFIRYRKILRNPGASDWLEKLILPAGLAAAGYLSVTGFWYLRNLQTFGSLLAPGGGAALWLTNYNQTFTFHPEELNMNHWLASGAGAILKVRLNSLFSNLATGVGVEGLVLLVPFFVVGLRKNWNESILRIAAGFWLVIFLIMTFIFPFAGARGGFLHSSAGFQPLIWAVSASGFSAVFDWGSRKKMWMLKAAWKMFSIELVTILAVITLVFGAGIGQKLVKMDQVVYPSAETYRAIAAAMDQNAGIPSDIVLINNPPAYSAATERSAIVIPEGDAKESLSAADQFHAGWLVLDENHVAGLTEMYLKAASTERFEYITTIDGNQIYRIQSR
jgi:hypothetical protein